MSAEERARSRTQDAEARQLAQREFEKPIVLEAGAGTGKTATLVARVLAWTLGKGWERAEQALRDSAGGEPPAAERIAARTLERVVAITFTDAAAAEMAQRVDEALGEIESGELPIGAEKSLLPNLELRMARGRTLRGELDHLVVQTIHAYCWRLLGTHPLEAGLHPTLEVDDDKREAAGVVREVVERRLRDAYMNPKDDAALSLAEAGYGPSELEQEINLLLDQGVQTDAFREDPLAPARVRAECARLYDAVAALGDEFGKALGAATRVKKATEVVRALEQTREHLAVCRESPENLGALIESLRECWDDTRIDRLKNWEKNVFKQGERNAIDGREARLAELASAVRAPLVQWLTLDVDLFQAARKLLVVLLDEVEDVMRRNGKITFSGLLIAAAGLVGNHPDVARRLRSQIDQILVDEFQDTDPCQCAIIEALALEGKPGERPGLFIVGDPKQSIYGWRSADLLAYEKFLDRVRASGGEKHPLTVNYRSVPAILEEVSRVIGPVMLREPGLQPAFEPLVACPDLETAMGFDADRFAPVEYWLSADADADGLTKTTAGRAALLEARALAADLRRLHDVCGVGWGEVAILFRSRGDLEIYLRELREAQVPFAVEGDRSYYRRREIIEVAAIVCYVLDPNDHLALLTLLRCSAVGVPDAALIPLWRGQLPALFGALGDRDSQNIDALRAMIDEVVRTLPGDIPGLERVQGWEANLLAAADAIADLRRSFDEDPSDVFVEKLRTRLLFEVGEAARFLGAWRVANLERFFGDLLIDLADARDTQRVLRRLRSAVSDEESTEEGQPRDLAPDAVHIMTLHGAKGLGFEHVYLMQLHKGAAANRRPSSEVGQVDGTYELRLFGSPSLGWDRVRGSKDRVEDAEIVRTLYVGMTRAKQRLVVSGAWPAFQKGSAQKTLVRLLEKRDPPAPDFEQAFASSTREDAGDFVDAAGARFVFAVRRATEAKSGTATQAAESLDLERVRSDSEWLRRKKSEADARMARRFSTSASQVAHGADDDTPSARADHSEATGRGDSDAGMGRVAGIAVHRILETFEFDTDPDAELVRKGEQLDDVLRPHVPVEQLDEAIRFARERVEKLRAGTLLRRLYDLREHIVARELPVLLAAESDDPSVEVLSGTIDLVYRDPRTEEWVIVDYKTDDVGADGEAALSERTRRYAKQGAVYQRAIRDAFGLDATPRFELWYLSHDRLVDASEAISETIVREDPS